MRVIRESPRWMPAVFYGEKLPFVVRQPVIFKVDRGQIYSPTSTFKPGFSEKILTSYKGYRI
jgi:hypothetical protein